MDMGDNVIVINAEKVQMTGNKRADKRYYWHTGFPGGIKHRTAGQILEGKHPERVIVKAVERMLPGGPLSRKQMGNLRVYAGAEHPHAAQNPEVLDLAAREPQEHPERLNMADLHFARPSSRDAVAARRSRRRPKREPQARQPGPLLRHRQAQGRGRPRLDQAGQRQGHRQRQGDERLLRPSRCCRW